MRVPTGVTNDTTPLPSRPTVMVRSRSDEKYHDPSVGRSLRQQGNSINGNASNYPKRANTIVLIVSSPQITENLVRA